MLQQSEFGSRLRALREKRGLSQAALAEGAISTGYLSRLESGARRPTPRVVAYLAQRLGVPVSVLEDPSADPVDAVEASPFTQVLATVISASGHDRAAEPLAEALRADGQRDPAQRWQALWLLAEIRGDEGERDEQRHLLEELVELSGQLGVASLLARAQTQLSRCLRTLGDTAGAREYAQRAYDVAGELSLTDRAATLQALVSALAEAGRLDEARTHADELCRLTEPAGGTLHVEALWAAATVRTRQGDHAGAIVRLEEALSGANSRQDLHLWIRLHLAAASLYLQTTPAQPEQARAVLDTVEPVLRLIGTERHHQEHQSLRAHLAFAEGRLDDARAICDAAADRRSLLSFRDRLKLAALQARLAILGGDADGGIRALQDVARQAEQAHNVELAAELWRSLAETLARPYGGDPALAGRAPTG
ncbi:helix-turn-helix domain-containing protein [Micromonospora sp. WMMA1998]|uniref:helix-turn-helix domain-containing protein n=1 Tax=Micromonospora sp. WMMA1998 TaxID=3015167 RepID=UPI00248CCC16|nr:helix-turn-helix domain-containing protein [Micromonospora sp. WMMA1998]WBC15456.1 helix-turn-helix domain-containing protein [Micromonospora sp. WMMA1998]